MEEGIEYIKIQKSKSGNHTTLEDAVAVEAPLEIQIQEFGKEKPRAISVTMRTPGDDEDLALGFLFTEGILHNYSQVKAVKYHGENIVKIYVKEGVEIHLQNTERNFYTTSSCGVCGKASIDAIRTKTQFEISSTTVPSANVLFSLKDKLVSEQSLFSKTGGIHAAAIFDSEGKLILMHEDVGRHNALDKVIGECFRRGLLPLNDKTLLLSGRTSFELVQKATMAGIPTIVSVGAPSSLAVELARESGQNLIGFLKNNSYNLYT
ncbi:MAG: formate dehydrogenase accessory sulfurtransferase FdhD [Bacteroidia bacterium]